MGSWFRKPPEIKGIGEKAGGSFVLPLLCMPSRWKPQGTNVEDCRRARPTALVWGDP